jgi:hypothetical protein
MHHPVRHKGRGNFLKSLQVTSSMPIHPDKLNKASMSNENLCMLEAAGLNACWNNGQVKETSAFGAFVNTMNRETWHLQNI